MSATRHRSDGHEEIVALDALPLSAAVRRRELSCREVMQAYLAQIERFNPRVNAIVSLQAESRLLAQADERDRQLARGEWLGWMHGMPQAIKDLAATSGIPTTLGSPLFAGQVPEHDAIVVERVKSSGAIVIGKTNVPEFGLGSQTYNPLFGTTRNAYDPARIAGGSSGGAAVALALRMLPVADGSDMMGSLRNPPPTTTSTASARPRDGCRTARKRNCSSSNWPPKARWGAAWPTWPGCWPPRPATIRAVRCRCATIRAGSPTTSGATSAEPGSAGSATTPATCRWRRACWSFAKPRWAISPSWAATSRRACRTIPWSACGAPGWSIASGWCRARLASFTPIPHGASDSSRRRSGKWSPGSASAPPRSIAPRWIAATGIGRWRVCSNVTISSCCPAPRCFLSMQKRRGRGRSPGGRWTPITAGWRW